MKKSYPAFIPAIFSTILITFAATFPTFAANDPSIKGNLRHNIIDSMNQYIQTQSIDKTMYVYDAVDGKLLKLTLDELHDGVVNKSGFYVSCADFKYQYGRNFDVDFLVRPAYKSLVTTQALIHSVNGNKRQYHLETL